MTLKVSFNEKLKQMNFEIYDTGSGMDDLDLRKMINGEVDSLIIKNPGMKLPLVN